MVATSFVAVAGGSLRIAWVVTLSAIVAGSGCLNKQILVNDHPNHDHASLTRLGVGIHGTKQNMEITTLARGMA